MSPVRSDQVPQIPRGVTGRALSADDSRRDRINIDLPRFFCLGFNLRIYLLIYLFL